MTRFVHQVVSSLTIVGYLLVVTWGPAWHEHHHSHSHACLSEQDAPTGVETEASHSACCSHHQPACVDEPREQAVHDSAPSHGPCHSPWHDDDCPVCQTLAHPPLASPSIELVEAPEPVRAWVLSAAPLLACSLSPVYDSRGPPPVGCHG